jgi:hypothetical protein
MNIDDDEWDDEWDGMGDDDDDDGDDIDDGFPETQRGETDFFAAYEASTRQEFQDYCAALRRNDPEKTTVNALSLKGYGVPLGNALVGNTYVEKLYLCLLAENVNSPNDDNWGVHNIALLLQYLREGAAFQNLCIWGGSLQYTSACVQAIAQNPNTRNLSMEGETEIPLLEMMDLMRTSESLQSLLIPMLNSTALAEAIQANQSLGTLELRFDPHSWPKPNGVILHHLHSHTKLQDLNISQSSYSLDTEQFDAALSSLLAHHSTQIKRLKLIYFTFNRIRMETFVEGLQANRCLEKLEFLMCDFDAEVTTFLESVVLSPTKHGNVSTFPIGALVVTQNDNGFLVALLTLMFTNLQELQWLRRDREGSSAAFWDRLLAADTSRIRLRSLQLDCWQKCDAMNSCIPKLVTLRELHFFSLSSYSTGTLSDLLLEAMQSFVKAVNQSTGLLLVPEETFLWIGELESRVLNASLQRNRLRPQLLSRPRLDHLMQDFEDGTDLYLYPSLFAVSQQSSYGALNAILTGMLALSDDLGPK